MSDWSSDGCASDRPGGCPRPAPDFDDGTREPRVRFRRDDHRFGRDLPDRPGAPGATGGVRQGIVVEGRGERTVGAPVGEFEAVEPLHRIRSVEARYDEAERELGRASCRARVCPYVKISVVAVTLKKKNNE